MIEKYVCPVCKKQKNRNEISKFFVNTKYTICIECLKEDKTLYIRGQEYIIKNK